MNHTQNMEAILSELRIQYSESGKRHDVELLWAASCLEEAIKIWSMAGPEMPRRKLMEALGRNFN